MLDKRYLTFRGVFHLGRNQFFHESALCILLADGLAIEMKWVDIYF